MSIASKSVLETSNRAKIQIINKDTLAAVAADVANHKSSTKTNAHLISNINGLSELLGNITDELATKGSSFTGYTGSVQVIKGVNFTNSTVTTATINISNGIIVSIT